MCRKQFDSSVKTLMIMESLDVIIHRFKAPTAYKNLPSIFASQTSIQLVTTVKQGVKREIYQN